jgi:hypothetical protein
MAGSLNSSEEMQGMSAMMGSKEAVNSKSSSFHLPKISKREVETDQQSQLQEGNELMQQARLKLGFEYCHGVVFVFLVCEQVEFCCKFSPLGQGQARNFGLIVLWGNVMSGRS